MAQSDAPANIVEVKSFTVIGISCRTTNAKEASGQGCIGKQWAQLITGDVLSKIPHREDKNTIAVYTDYASDKDGEYTYVLGAKVKNDAVAPVGMVKVTVPSGRYAKFTSDTGPAPVVVPANWKKVWATSKAQPGGDRTYKTDFEVYDQRASDPQKTQMDIYVGVR